MKFTVLTILTILLLALRSCGKREPVTLTQWREDHPYAKRVMSVVADGGMIAQQYEDTVPRIDFVGTTSVYTETKYTYSHLVGRDDIIVSSHVDRSW